MVTSEQENRSVTDMVGTLDRSRGRQVRKLALIRGLWVGLLLLFLAFYLDARFPSMS